MACANGGVPVQEEVAAAHGFPSLEDMKPQERFSYVLSRDREYISYVEALDLDPETRNRLWHHLTRKYEAAAQLDLWAERELGRTYKAEVDLLVITYDPDSEHYRRREKQRKAADDELRAILSEEQLERYHRYRDIINLERRRRQLRHEIEDMELDLQPSQFDVARQVLENKPAFFQQTPLERGATGYSLAYIQDRERWRFEQEQNYLEANLIPILEEAQVQRFQKWQEAERIHLNRRLDMYKAGEEFMAHLYPERKRRVRMLSPADTDEQRAKRPVYIECRNNQMFHVPVDLIRRRASEKLREIGARKEGTATSLMQELAAARVEISAYRADLTYSILGQLALHPRPQAQGYFLDDIREEKDQDWYGKILADMDPHAEALVFVVRDDSLAVFERASKLAKAKGLEVRYSVLDPVAPIKFDMGGATTGVKDEPMDPAFGNVLSNGKKAVYMDIFPGHIVLRPEGKKIPAEEISEEGSVFGGILQGIAESKNDKYIVLLLRPRSARLAERVKEIVRRHGIELGEKLYEGPLMDSPNNP